MIIDNITANDSDKGQIRITSENKSSFPRESIGETITHDLLFQHEGKEYPAKYRIGSRDGRSRSGGLKLDRELYQNVLRIRVGTRLEIRKVRQNEYSISRMPT